MTVDINCSNLEVRSHVIQRVLKIFALRDFLLAGAVLLTGAVGAVGTAVAGLKGFAVAGREKLGCAVIRIFLPRKKPSKDNDRKATAAARAASHFIASL